LNGGIPAVEMPLESIVAVAFVMIGILLLLWIAAMIRISRLNKRLKAFLRETGVTNLQEVIGKLYEQTKENAVRVEELRKNNEYVMQKTERMISNVGFKRYKAFGEGTGELSFSLAIVNDRKDGVVLSALNSRDESRIYAKLLKEGASTITLTQEEQEVIAQATNMM